MSQNLQVPALLINGLIDEGAKEDINLVVEKSLDKTLFSYLADKYQNEEFNVFAKKGTTEDYLQEFFNTYSGNDFRRKFAVENNGLNLLVAALIFA